MSSGDRAIRYLSFFEKPDREDIIRGAKKHVSILLAI
jgi:hypothetical protein